MAKYSAGKNSYEVVLCSKEDIEGDYYRVFTLVSDVDSDLYVEWMETAVEQELAFRCTKNGVLAGFIYVRKEKNHWLGCSLLGLDVVGMMLAWKELYEKIGDVFVKFNPHEGELGQLKSLVTGTSVRRYYNGVGYISVSTKKLAVKQERLYRLLGVRDECGS